MEEIKENIEIQKVKRGRPKQINKEIISQKDYNKNYYLNNKDKHIGNFQCEICQLYCSKSNKTRHMKVCKEKALFNEFKEIYALKNISLKN